MMCDGSIQNKRIERQNHESLEKHVFLKVPFKIGDRMMKYGSLENICLCGLEMHSLLIDVWDGRRNI
jgi:hypothetical protein